MPWIITIGVVVLFVFAFMLVHTALQTKVKAEEIGASAPGDQSKIATGLVLSSLYYGIFLGAVLGLCLAIAISYWGGVKLPWQENGTTTAVTQAVTQPPAPPANSDVTWDKDARKLTFAAPPANHKWILTVPPLGAQLMTTNEFVIPKGVDFVLVHLQRDNPPAASGAIVVATK